MESMENGAIKRLGIYGSAVTEFGCLLRYEFEFASGCDSIELEFSLPKRSVVTGLSVVIDGERFGGEVVGMAECESGDFSLSCGEDGYVFSARNLSGADFTLEVGAAVMLSVGDDGGELIIPLETINGTAVQPETVRRQVTPVECRVGLEFLVQSPEICEVKSPTHDCTCEAAEDGLKLACETSTGGEFVLYFNRRGGFRNTAYISGESCGDRTGVYLFKAGEAVSENRGDILFVIDGGRTDRVFESEVVIRMLRQMDEFADCMFALANGGLFSESAVTVRSVDTSALTAWLCREHNDKAARNIDEIIREYADVRPSGEVVYITPNGMCSIEPDCGAAVNVFSVSDRLDEYVLRKIAADSGGVYAKMKRGVDYDSFIAGFMKRVCSGHLKNLKILEYAAGTYFNLPRAIRDCRVGDVIVYTFRTNGDCPEQLFLEADGGFSHTVRFDKFISEDGVCGAEAVFAAQVFDGLYNYIGRGDVAPKSVAELKAQAVKLSREAGVICPETAYAISVHGVKHKVVSRGKLNLRLEPSHENRRAYMSSQATILGDTVRLSGEKAAETVRRAVYAMLTRMRADYIFPSDTGAIDDKTATMYAVAAILRAVESGFLTDEYKTLADMARDASDGGRASFESTAIKFSSGHNYDMTEANRIIDSRRVVDISEMILTLCSRCDSRSFI